MKIKQFRSKQIVAFGLLTLMSCAEAEEDDPSTADAPASSSDDAVYERLEDLGFPLDDVHVNGDYVSVDDISLERSRLLAGEYDWVKSRNAAPDQNKAHYVGGTPLVWQQSAAIKLVWSTGTDAPSTAIKNAVINAAGDFNSTCSTGPGCLISFSQNNAGPWLVVHMTPVGSWPPPACTTQVDKVGCATFPSSGSPGGHIYFKASALSANCQNWTTDSLAYIARHEMMHTLGINHTGVGTLISNTVAAPASTVMKETATFNASCGLSPTILQTDDKAGLRNLPIGSAP